MMKADDKTWEEKLREEPKETIGKLIDLLKGACQPNADRTERLSLEMGVANAINFSAYKGYITGEEARDYRIAVLQIGGATL